MQQTSAGQDLADANEKSFGGRGATVMSPPKEDIEFDLRLIAYMFQGHGGSPLFGFSAFRLFDFSGKAATFRLFGKNSNFSTFRLFDFSTFRLFGLGP